jgi:hypothetical protein
VKSYFPGSIGCCDVVNQEGDYITGSADSDEASCERTNGNFIAALNPQTVKHLLAVCRAADALGLMPTDSGVLVTHNEMKELTAALTNLEKAIGK